MNAQTQLLEIGMSREKIVNVFPGLDPRIAEQIVCIRLYRDNERQRGNTLDLNLAARLFRDRGFAERFARGYDEKNLRGLDLYGFVLNWG